MGVSHVVLEGCTKYLRLKGCEELTSLLAAKDALSVWKCKETLMNGHEASNLFSYCSALTLGEFTG
jgi:hypothetical protein